MRACARTTASPVSPLTIESDLRHALDFIASRQRARITHRPATLLSKVAALDFDGRLLPRAAEPRWCGASVRRFRQRRVGRHRRDLEEAVTLGLAPADHRHAHQAATEIGRSITTLHPSCRPLPTLTIGRVVRQVLAFQRRESSDGGGGGRRRDGRVTVKSRSKRHGLIGCQERRGTISV